PGTGTLESIVEMARECINGTRLDGLITDLRGMGGQYELILNRVLAKPKPRTEEWISTFQAFTAEAEPGAKAFDAQMSIEYLGRIQSRTVMQTVVKVPRAAATLE